MIVIIILILAFSIIRFIPFMFSSFANVGNSIKSPFDKTLEIKMNQTDLTSGDIFRVSWKFKEQEDNGTLNLTYECNDNLKLFIYNQESTELICNRAYRLNPNQDFIDLKIILNKKNTYRESNLKVFYLNSQQENIAEDEINFSVTNQDNLPVDDFSGSAIITSQQVEDSQEQESNQINQGPNQRVSALPADLVIRNVNSFDNRIVFDVANIGGQPTGNWYFTYNVPNESIENSPIQISLNPGSAIRYTLTFDDINSGNATIILDPANLIRESSETNNSTTVFVRSNNLNNSNNDNRYDFNRNDEADLVIRDLEVGRMSGSRFVEDDEIDEDDDAAIRFVVVNIGGESTGDWRFEIDNTPYDDRNNDYRSNRQNSLRPGESTEIIVEFENPDDGRYRIKVTVDSDDDVDEEDERNNDESEVLEVKR